METLVGSIYILGNRGVKINLIIEKGLFDLLLPPLLRGSA
jgi:hypothetical protein